MEKEPWNTIPRLFSDRTAVIRYVLHFSILKSLVKYS
nr:MAG TPA: hypothetical protein [Caudoviricetes sp.]